MVWDAIGGCFTSSISRAGIDRSPWPASMMLTPSYRGCITYALRGRNVGLRTVIPSRSGHHSMSWKSTSNCFAGLGRQGAGTLTFSFLVVFPVCNGGKLLPRVIGQDKVPLPYFWPVNSTKTSTTMLLT